MTGCQTGSLISEAESIYWPVKEVVLTQNYHEDGRRPHWGLDLSGPSGTNIYASHEGKVVVASNRVKGYGRMVMIEREDGVSTIYAHLKKIKVKVGQKIATRQLVGLMGRTGRATGVHLHFEVRYNKTPLDPLTLLPPWTPSTVPPPKLAKVRHQLMPDVDVNHEEL